MISKLIKKYENLMNSNDSKLKKKYMALLLSILIGAGYFFGSITHASALSDEEKEEALKNAKATSYEQIEENPTPYNNKNYDIIVTLVISPSDTLDEIAKEYNVTTEDLMTINNYKTTDDFKAGNSIVVGSVKNNSEGKKKVINVSEYKNETNDKTYQQENNTKDWQQAMDANNGYTYVIDVSSSNIVDLNRILKNNPEISGVMIRTSYEWNNNFKDKEMEKYVKACVDNNCDFGFYCWPTFRSVEETDKQLDNVMNVINDVCEKYNTQATLPLAFDVEADEFSRDLMKRINQNDSQTIRSIEYGIEKIKENGFYPMIYSGLGCVADKQGNNLSLGNIINDNDVDCWIARYPTNDKVSFGDELLKYYPQMSTMYQFTGNGKVKGIDGVVDISVTNINLPEKVANFTSKSR